MVERGRGAESVMRRPMPAVGVWALGLMGVRVWSWAALVDSCQYWIGTWSVGDFFSDDSGGKGVSVPVSRTVHMQNLSNATRK